MRKYPLGTAVLIFLIATAASTAAQEEATSPTDLLFATAEASGPRTASSAHGAIRGLLGGMANVQNDTRVTQAPSHADSYWYGRFGYGTIAGDQRYGGLGFGFGRRIERNAIGVDVLLFSGQIKMFGTYPADLHSIGGIYTNARAASLLTTKALYFVRPKSRTTPYLGAGAGWKTMSFKRSFEAPREFRDRGVGGDLYDDWHGSGLEAEFTVGYAFARANTSTRLFVQADFTRPFFRVKRFSRTGAVVGDRYATMLVVSLGAGW